MSSDVEKVLLLGDDVDALWGLDSVPEPLPLPPAALLRLDLDSLVERVFRRRGLPSFTAAGITASKLGQRDFPL